MANIITQAHGSGGRAYRKLVEEIISPALASEMLDIENDSAVLPSPRGRLAMTTDSFVIKPLFFPGGDIGRLAVCGTVNDIAVSGARPLYLTSSFIIETGFPIDELEKICRSMSKAAAEAGVHIVTGDTKVVPHGACDGIYINTAGVGELPECHMPPRAPKIGDVILLSGDIGVHEAVIAAQRDGSIEQFSLESDVAPIAKGAAALFDAMPVAAMRDPTRGGVAAVLNEFAEKFSVTITVDERRLPVDKQVAALCDIYGFEPLHMANEGKFVAIIPAEYAEKAVSLLHSMPQFDKAAIIGSITADDRSVLVLDTVSGGRRIVTMPQGELLPRIC